MITDVQSVRVMYHDTKVGTLSVGTNQRCLFEYDKRWLTDGFSISPLKLPLKPGLMMSNYFPFNGNFGVFEDSLPGGYGEYLLRKMLKKSGDNYEALTPVQRLCLVGCSGMGALTYEPDFQLPPISWQGSFDQMQQMVLDVLSEKTEENMDALFFKSGNSGGARPKCIYSDKEGHWLVKFRHPYDPQNIGELEYYYNQMARQCGIVVPDFKLIEGKYFASRRFDIEKGQRLHVVTASGLLDESINPPKMDYHSLLQLTGFLTQSPDEVEQQFRRMVFNVAIGNFDDHARNFSFICCDGKWTLSPAYDLTNDNTLGEHATTINYKGIPTNEDMIVVGTNIRISRSRCQEIITEINDVVNDKSQQAQ